MQDYAYISTGTVHDIIKAYKVLADESRLRVLNLLLESECCVCEVMQALEISQSKASRILGALHDVGFLKLRKDGLWSLYSIDRQGMDPHLRDVLEATRKACQGSGQLAADRERLSAAERVGPGCISGLRRPRLSANASQS